MTKRTILDEFPTSNGLISIEDQVIIDQTRKRARSKTLWP